MNPFWFISENSCTVITSAIISLKKIAIGFLASVTCLYFSCADC